MGKIVPQLASRKVPFNSFMQYSESKMKCSDLKAPEEAIQTSLRNKEFSLSVRAQMSVSPQKPVKSFPSSETSKQAKGSLK